MNSRIQKLKQDWENRNKLFGNSKRAVLFKRFPAFLNNYIHKKHTNFIIKNIPTDSQNLLDVGCGYGRISQEIKTRYSHIKFHGVELCTEFAEHYEKNFGPCFNGAIQEFTPKIKYDVIIIVTLLMYLSESERVEAIKILWASLAPNGTLICIEPAVEFIQLWKKMTKTKNASPTGDNVKYFKMSDLKGLFPSIVNDSTSIKIIPFIRKTTLHHALAITKIKLNNRTDESK